eukprot:1131123-Pyramimonas_sp.AAC.1
MNMISKGGGVAGLITIVDQYKEDNDVEVTTMIMAVLCEMANSFKASGKSIYGGLFVDLGLIRTCMQLLSDVRPLNLCSNDSAHAPRDDADLIVRTLYPLLVLKKDTTIEFFRENGMQVRLAQLGRFGNSTAEKSHWTTIVRQSMLTR